MTEGTSTQRSSSPRYAGRLHPVGQRHVVRPDVVLPLAQADDAAQHVPRVNADPHVDIHSCGFPHLPGERAGHLSEQQLHLIFSPPPGDPLRFSLIIGLVQRQETNLRSNA